MHSTVNIGLLLQKIRRKSVVNGLDLSVSLIQENSYFFNLICQDYVIMMIMVCCWPVETVSSTTSPLGGHTSSAPTSNHQQQQPHHHPPAAAAARPGARPGLPRTPPVLVAST